MSVFVEVWVGEVIQRFRKDTGFMARIPKKNELAKNRVIHFTDLGADPTVLVDNTVYPITTTDANNVDAPVSLRYLETTNTGISKKDLNTQAIDVIGEYTRTHVEVLQEASADLAIFSMAPAATSVATPVVSTTGDSDGAASARKQITMPDIARLKRLFDDAKVPKKDRILVLCPQHVEQLLNISEAFRLQYKDVNSGEFTSLYGFEIFEYQTVPAYTAGLTRKAFGAVYNPSTDNYASVAFYAGNTFQVSDEPDMYYTEAEKSAGTRKNEIGFSLWYLAMPKKAQAIGAIVSVPV